MKARWVFGSLLVAMLFVLSCTNAGTVPPANIAPEDVKLHILQNERAAKQYFGKRVRTVVKFMGMGGMQGAPPGYDESWNVMSVMTCDAGQAPIGGNIQFVAQEPNATKMLEIKNGTAIEVVGIVREGGIVNSLEVESYKAVEKCE
jgi:hypothetical protein